MHHKVSQTHTKSCAYHEIGTNIAGQMYAENLYGGTKSHHISPLLDLQPGWRLFGYQKLI